MSLKPTVNHLFILSLNSIFVIVVLQLLTYILAKLIFSGYIVMREGTKLWRSYVLLICVDCVFAMGPLHLEFGNFSWCEYMVSPLLSIWSLDCRYISLSGCGSAECCLVFNLEATLC